MPVSECLACGAPMRRVPCTCCGFVVRDCSRCIAFVRLNGKLRIARLRCATCIADNCRAYTARRGVSPNGGDAWAG